MITRKITSPSDRIVSNPINPTNLCGFHVPEKYFLFLQSAWNLQWKCIMTIPFLLETSRHGWKSWFSPTLKFVFRFQIYYQTFVKLKVANTKNRISSSRNCNISKDDASNIILNAELPRYLHQEFDEISSAEHCSRLHIFDEKMFPKLRNKSAMHIFLRNFRVRSEKFFRKYISKLKTMTIILPTLNCF